MTGARRPGGGGIRYSPLSSSDRIEFREFMTLAPEFNVVPLYNSGRFGMDEGDLPLSGHYFGRRESGRLVAAGAVYNLGSLFFYAIRPEAVEGMAGYLLSSGRAPWFTQGRSADIGVLLEESARLGGRRARAVDSEYLVLRGHAGPRTGQGRARPARVTELPTLVELGRAMHRELFGTEGVDGESLAEILREQIDTGGAFVVEEDGRIVSKAEATPVEPFAALVGGVYTVPEKRGRGLSTACVATLCRSLLDRVAAVALSVEKENAAARRVYERTGFRKVADWRAVTFEEAGKRG